MELREAKRLAAQLRASGHGLDLRAEVRPTEDSWRIYFCGGKKGENSVDALVSDRSAILSEWATYIRQIGTKRPDLASLPESIPAISVRQPWAELIARREKTIEAYRDLWWHRGWLVIHASKAVPSAADLRDAGISQSGKTALAFGETVAIVWLADARLPERGDAKRALCNPGKSPVLVLESAQRLSPRPYRGQPGLFYVPRDLIVLA